MKRRTRAAYKHPTTYEEIVAYEHDRHTRRLMQLKQAEKAIRAVSDDLATLSAHHLVVSVGGHSMYLLDCKHYFETNGRSKSALFLDSGIFRQNGDRLVEGFISLGWLVEALNAERALPRVLLRRLKTQVRIILDVTDEFAKSLQSREVQK